MDSGVWLEIKKDEDSQISTVHRLSDYVALLNLHSDEICYNTAEVEIDIYKIGTDTELRLYLGTGVQNRNFVFISELVHGMLLLFTTKWD